MEIPYSQDPFLDAPIQIFFAHAHIIVISTKTKVIYRICSALFHDVTDYSHNLFPNCEVDQNNKMGGENEVANKYGASYSGGAKVVGIAGRMASERERMLGMTDAERSWRAQYLKDQLLHDEPIMPKDYYKERYNPIRRFYRAPLDKLQSALLPVMGATGSEVTRHVLGKFGFLVVFVYSAHYYLKYNRGDWTRKGGWRVVASRPASYPGDPGFPNIKDTKPTEYATFGFEKSPL